MPTTFIYIVRALDKYVITNGASPIVARKDEQVFSATNVRIQNNEVIIGLKRVSLVG